MISRLKGRILLKNRLRFGNRILSGVLSLSMAVSLLSGMAFMQKADAAEQVTLHNPVVDMDAMCAGQKVTWDCVWFGSYPQTEVKPGDSEYEALQSAEGWDGNGDVVINDTKYRRMLKDDATYATSGDSDYYDWEDDTTYHYFRYEPVKWRVLETDGSNAMLLSDIVLDDRKYNTEKESVTWQTSTIRSWLNGYNADMNAESIDYSSNNFIYSAFTTEEQSAIADTDVVNNDIEGGNDTNGIKTTMDKLFLLSESEVYTDTASIYGFAQVRGIYDEARRCKSSDYAKAMGVLCDRAAEWNCYWWLRSPGDSSFSAAYVNRGGYVNNDGINVDDNICGVRVALNLNLSSFNPYAYAGTVCSDGIIEESGKTEENILNPRIVKVTDAPEGQNVKWDCVYFGSYPQTEIEKADSEYAVLQSEEGWDGNGDIVVNGTKYRRMLKDDATYTTSGDEHYYNWEDNTTYHYFKYESVKWRVLKTDGSNAMLLSDIVLDDRKYNAKDKDTTWETSTIRSWLNGYTGDMNQEGINYSSGNFIDSAFTIEEQSAITDTNVVNNDNLSFGTEGGNDTMDKLFLLSEAEIYTKEAKAYGFSKDYFVDDISRRCKSSDYAKAMGVYSGTSTDYKENCYWWLRSPGHDSSNASNVDKCGDINDFGNIVYCSSNGVRVALNLNLSSSNLYTYAGTVCSDGTVDIIEEPTTEDESTENPKVYTVTFKDGDDVLSVQKVEFGMSAKVPEVEEREGYRLSWDKSFAYIEEDTVINAVWTEKKTTDVTIHFRNTDNWDNVGIWVYEGVSFNRNVTPKNACPAYHTSTDPEIAGHPIWPGARMTAEKDYDGWYTIDVSFEDTSKGAIMIFNNLVADTKADTGAGYDDEDQGILEDSGLIMDTNARKQSPNQVITPSIFATGAGEFWCDFDGDVSGATGRLTSTKPDSYKNTSEIEKPTEKPSTEEPTTEESGMKDVTIHFRNTDNWDNVGIWVYEGVSFNRNVTPKNACPAYHTSADPEIAGHPIWPGARMTAEKDYDGWYTIDVSFEDTSKGAIMIFNNLVADTKADTSAGYDDEDQGILEDSGLIMDTNARKQSPNQVITPSIFATGAGEFWCDFDGDVSGATGRLTSTKPDSYKNTSEIEKPTEKPSMEEPTTEELTTKQPSTEESTTEEPGMKDVTIHFKNTDNWDNVGIWVYEGVGFNRNVTPKNACPAYHTSTDPEIASHPIWPGAKMTAEKDYDGWYTIDVSFEDTSKGAIMIFNNLVAYTKTDTGANYDDEDQSILEDSGLIMDTNARKQSPNQVITSSSFATGAGEFWCDFDGNLSGSTGRLTSTKPDSYKNTSDIEKPTEKPSTEEPTTEELTTKQPSTEEPTTKQPSTEEPTTEQSSTEEPTTEQPSTEEPTTEQPSTEEPTTEQSSTEEPNTEESETEEPETEEPETEELTTEQRPAKKSQTIKVTKSYIKTYGAKAFKLNAKLTKGNGALRYASSNKNVAAVDKNGKVTIKNTGICTITVTASATSTYKAASAKITITVKPKKNTVTKIKASGSRILNVTWKKDTKCAGYELQCSTSKKFASKDTITINIGKNKTTSYKIRKLAKGKKYYIRVRSYQNVKENGKTKKLYGDWSAVKQSGKVK